METSCTDGHHLTLQPLFPAIVSASLSCLNFFPCSLALSCSSPNHFRWCPFNPYWSFGLSVLFRDLSFPRVARTWGEAHGQQSPAFASFVALDLVELPKSRSNLEREIVLGSVEIQETRRGMHCPCSILDISEKDICAGGACWFMILLLEGFGCTCACVCTCTCTTTCCKLHAPGHLGPGHLR